MKLRIVWAGKTKNRHMAKLCAEDIDWNTRAISYSRQKTGSQAVVYFGDTVAEILKNRPKSGYLFPQVSQWKESDRARHSFADVGWSE